LKGFQREIYFVDIKEKDLYTRMENVSVSLADLVKLAEANLSVDDCLKMKALAEKMKKADISVDDCLKMKAQTEKRNAYMKEAMKRYDVEARARKWGVPVKDYLHPDFQKYIRGKKCTMTWEQYVESTNRVVNNPRGKARRAAKGITEPLVV
jgi:hypothetical protein